MRWGSASAAGAYCALSLLCSCIRHASASKARTSHSGGHSFVGIRAIAGARGLRSILEKSLSPVLFEIPTMRVSGQAVAGVLVTEACVKEGRGAEIVMDKGRWLVITGGTDGAEMEVGDAGETRRQRVTV